MELLTRRTILMCASSVIAGVAAPGLFAQAAPVAIVEMLNSHPTDRALRMVFTPRILQIEPGESVLIQATDRGHSSASIAGMIPEGATTWSGQISQDINVTFDQAPDPTVIFGQSTTEIL
ncbi:hypothetical protein V8J82_22965 [Gymnodinialimonas sp. 2305UL16-5]|uniref:hypothetical protein n=1 Tax=Gymnodinialimonas mytili TaxID=3126503 RepID=UPI0030A1DB50